MDIFIRNSTHQIYEKMRRPRSTCRSNVDNEHAVACTAERFHGGVCIPVQGFQFPVRALF
jgi:hypothetical protein